MYCWKYINSNSVCRCNFFFFLSISTKCKCITNDSRNLEIVILFFGRIFYKRYFCANA